MEPIVKPPRRGAQPALPPALFGFMRELREHNDRDWFKTNKPRYEEVVQEPALAFITDFAPRLHAISSHFVADARPVGGSLFRIYRDTRFGKDKTPYKTHTGIHFRHAQAKDVHAPGFYLHLEPGAVFAGMGIWRPDSVTLGRIRDAIADDPEAWTAVLAETTRGDRIRLEGDTLKRAPAGYDPEHPLIAELKRKDFIAIARLSEKAVTSHGFPEELAGLFQTSAPLMRFVCTAAGVPF
jgi:uncharacterized protein (TIGR02453 family)